MVEYLKSLDDPGSMIPLTFMRAREVLMSEIRPILQQYGLTEVQWRVMRVLYLQETIDFGELAEVTLVQRASLSRVIPTMVDKGLVVRETNPDDNRLITISRTPRTVELVDHVMPRIHRVYTDIGEKVGDPGFTHLRQVLETFIDQGTNVAVRS